jgi:thymidylate synthase
MSSIEEQYRGLLGSLLHNSVKKSDRTGTGTHSIFGRQIRHDMKQGFPLLTTKRMAVKTMMTELKWFLKGDTNIKYLVDNGCSIWNGDAYKAFKSTFSPMPGIQSSLPSQDEFIDKIKTDNEFAQKWGELGPIYGKQWRGWFGYDKNVDPVFVDQIANLIEELKTNPDSRRLMVNAWNVGDLPTMALPPCHYGFQCYVRDGKYLSLMWNQRSVDTFLGLPFNIASYAALLCLIAEEVNMIPDQLIGNLGDVHLYSNHVDQAMEQISREIYDLPTVSFKNVNILDGEFDYEVHDYKYHPSIKAPLSN